LVRSVRERGYKGIIASGFSISDPSLASLGGSSLAETIFPTPFFYNNPLNPEAKMIFTKFKKRYKEEASYFTGMGYTAMKFLAMGIKLSGNGKSEDVSKALAKITRFESPYGTMVMVNGQGDYARLQGPTIAKWTKDGTQVVWVKPKK
ncbi:MAG: ABC transporter substrate-binding protein, partial [Ilumatobacteraceae bacterium]